MTGTLTNALAASGRKRTGPGAIITVLLDDHSVHCMTEELLDTWWHNLPAEQKGEIFDRAHDADIDAPADYSLRNGVSAFLDRCDAITAQAVSAKQRYRRLADTGLKQEAR